MILGDNRIPFSTPPAATPGYFPKLPHTGWYSGNIHPLSQVMHRTTAFPAYNPGVNPNAFPSGPVQFPAPAPATPPGAASTPGDSGTHGAGAFGVAGFGSHGGTRKHFHVSPYMVMRSGWIPGVDPSGSNIRSQVSNARARIGRQMPFQSAALAPISAPMPAVPAAAATSGFGNDEMGASWFRHHRSHRHHFMPMAPAAVATQTSTCEWLGPRLDGTFVEVCNGHVTRYRDRDGSERPAPSYPMAGSGAVLGDNDEMGRPMGWFKRTFGWRHARR
jgi:hypothetical protein